MLAMQHHDTINGAGHASARPFSKPGMNGDQAAISHGSFHSQQPSVGGYSDRHPPRGNIPNINTARLGQPGQVADMQTPGTAFDMNFTPLLPSQLLLGSPFQPGSPNAFSSPQFQSFGSFAGANNTAQQQQTQQGQLGGNAHNRVPLS